MKIPFIKSKNFTKGRGGKKVRLIVIHTMESGEQANKAKQVTQWFAGKTAPDASAHYMVDNKYMYNGVADADTAWATGHSDTNKCSISIELAGKASQTKTQWADGYSEDMLALASKLVASLCKKYNIPVKKLNPNQVKTGSGIIGHNTVTAAYNIKGGHSDPGNNFPWNDFISLVESEYNLLGGK
jgi:N-acetyl-anhydromuramyl-L-alanine amidase AmpD